MTLKKFSILAIIIISVFSITILAIRSWKEPRTALPDYGGNFTLQSEQGPVSLSDFRGKAVILYFGYTQCPDVCPLSLSIVGQAIRQLPLPQQESVHGIFVSVDPDRDSLKYLKTYSAFFSEHITGVTGDKHQVDKTVQQYGAFYRFVEIKDSAMGYAVDHSALLYLIDKKGELVKTLPHNINPALLTNEITNLL